MGKPEQLWSVVSDVLTQRQAPKRCHSRDVKFATVIARTAPVQNTHPAHLQLAILSNRIPGRVNFRMAPLSTPRSLPEGRLVGSERPRLGLDIAGRACAKSKTHISASSCVTPDYTLCEDDAGTRLDLLLDCRFSK